MRPTTLFLATLACMLVLASAQPHDSPQHRQPPRGINGLGCLEDIDNFCSQQKKEVQSKGEVPVIACLSANAKQLSTRCSEEVADTLEFACAIDAVAFCSGKERQELMQCMHAHASELSTGCKQKAEELLPPQHASQPHQGHHGHRGHHGHKKHQRNGGHHVKMQGRHRRPHLLPAACRSDVDSLCESEKQQHDVLAVLLCLRNKAQQLSQTCSTQLTKSTPYACAPDAQKYCSQFTMDPRDMMDCMNQNQDKLSTECTSAIENNPAPTFAHSHNHDHGESHHGKKKRLIAFIGGGIGLVALVVAVAFFIRRRRRRRREQRRAATVVDGSIVMSTPVMPTAPHMPPTGTASNYGYGRLLDSQA